MDSDREQMEDLFIQAEEDLLIDTLFLIEEVMREKGIDRTTLARSMGVSKARLSQLLNPGTNPTLKSLARVFAALGEEATLVVKREASFAQTAPQIGEWQASSGVADSSRRSSVNDWRHGKFSTNDNAIPAYHGPLFATAA